MTETSEDGRAAARRIADSLKALEDGLADSRSSPRPRSFWVARRAALRRGVGGPSGDGFGHDVRADAEVLKLMPSRLADRNDPSQEMEDAALVCMLVAFTRVPVRRPDPQSARSLGQDLRDVAKHHPERRRSGAYERLLREVLRSDRDRLAKPLRRTLTLVRNDGGGLDAESLLLDLGRWDLPDGRVQKRWAFHFWSDPAYRDDDTATTEEKA